MRGGLRKTPPTTGCVPLAPSHLMPGTSRLNHRAGLWSMGISAALCKHDARAAVRPRIVADHLEGSHAIDRRPVIELGCERDV